MDEAPGGDAHGQRSGPCPAQPETCPDNGAPAACQSAPVPDRSSLLLHEEEIEIARRTVETTVRVATVTHTRDVLVDQELVREDIDIQRVPIGRYVETAPPIREEGDVTILSVVEEVIERRLLLREEVHIRRVRASEHVLQTVSLRRQDAVVTRLPADRQPDPPRQAHPSQPASPPQPDPLSHSAPLSHTKET